MLRASWAEVEPVRGSYDTGVLERARKALLLARRRGLEPVVSVHRGALPDWQIARSGWLDPDAGAGWGCYVDKLAHAFGEQLRYWIAFEEPMAEATWYEGERAVVARSLLDHVATAYLHLKRAPGTSGRPPWVGVVERFAGWTEGRVRGRLDAALRSRLGPEALVKILATGRLAPPFAPVGELPNATPAADFFGVAWEGLRRTGDGERTGEPGEAELHALLDRLWFHNRPLVLWRPPPGTADAAWQRGVRVLASLGG